MAYQHMPLLATASTSCSVPVVIDDFVHITNVCIIILVSDIAIFVLKRDVKLQLTNLYYYFSLLLFINIFKIPPGVKA